MFGILNLNKPAGGTSRDVLNKISRRHRKLKIGHAGTLDPMATGVLVACVGPATRLIPYVQQLPKTYLAQFKLGFTSDTEDLEGDVRAVSDAAIVTASELAEVLPQFTGKIQQMPPKFSALKVKGKRAYDLARKGKPVELEAREIEIHSIRMLAFGDQQFSSPVGEPASLDLVPDGSSRPNTVFDLTNSVRDEKDFKRGRIQFNHLPKSCSGERKFVDFILEIVCGSGTYIRSLGRDIALAVGSSAVMSQLCRTAIGPFNLGNAIRPDELNLDDISQQLLSPLMALEGFPKVVINKLNCERLAVGQTVAQPLKPFEEDCAAVDESNRLFAIVHPENSVELHPKLNFANYWLR